MTLLDPSKVSIPLLLVVGLISTGAGAVGTYTAAKAKLEETAAGLTEARADVRRAQEDLQKIEVAHAEERGDVQARLKGIEASIERLERWAGTK